MVEILLAVGVLAAMTVPMIGLFQAGNRVGVASDNRLRAALLAHEIIERVRGEMDHWTLKSARRVSRPQVRLSAPKGVTYGVETRLLSEDLEELVVTIRWREGRHERKLALKSLVSRAPGIQSIRRKGAR